MSHCPVGWRSVSTCASGPGTAEFRVRAVDEQGVRSPWASAEPLWLAAAQETDEALTLSDGSSVVNDSRAFGGRLATTTAGGRTASFEFYASEVAWVAMRRPNGGIADVYGSGGASCSRRLGRSPAIMRSRFAASELGSWSTWMRC